MHALEPFSDDTEGTVFRDVVMLALAGFVAIVVLLLPHVVPRNTGEQSPAVPPGNLLVEVRWPDGSEADVDLWVEAPGDRPVGYANRGGQVFDLLRDDLGRRGDATDLNYESAFARGTPAGEYTINLHLYQATGDALPVPVDVGVSTYAVGGRRTQRLLERRAQLTRQGEELTVARFRLDERGELVPGSAHTLARPLRNRQGAG
jgi:hypothetical protein